MTDQTDISILLVDDSDDDILVITRAFQQAFIPVSLFAVKSGQAALAYLLGQPPYSERTNHPLPDLVLLDLKMPGMDGFEVLTWIRHQPGLSSLRVLVLTSSDHIYDVNQAYKLGANSFLVKPTDFENYMQLAKSIEEFWRVRSRAPDVHRPEATTPPNDPLLPLLGPRSTG